MKRRSLCLRGFVIIIILATIIQTFAGCSGAGTVSPSPTPKATVAPSAAASSLQTVDFSSLLKTFDKGQNKNATIDRTNIITADTTTTATVGVPKGQTTQVIMLKGNSGTLNATSTSSGTLTTDPAKNSYFANVVFMNNGNVAQYGDGIYKFKLATEGPYTGQFNNAVVFKTASPQKPLSDSSVAKALAITTVGGVVKIMRNYTDTTGKLVTMDLIKDTGVNVSDGKYHYYILAMQDVSNGTNIKLWIDGTVAYSGMVTGVTGTGAIQVINNSTPMFTSDGKPQIAAGVQAGTFQPVTACMESYFGGYEDGPAVPNISLDPIK